MDTNCDKPKALTEWTLNGEKSMKSLSLYTPTSEEKKIILKEFMSA